MFILNTHVASLATGLGSFVLLRWIYKLARNLAFFVRPSGIQCYLQTKSNEDPGSAAKEPWALIAGSGSGLGRAVAFSLADHGFNIILHGSNASKLHGVQNDLQAAHPTRSIRTLILDAMIGTRLSAPELVIKFDKVAHGFQDINFRILVNNVGMPQARPEHRNPIDKIDIFTYNELLQNVSGNALFPLLLTRALYPLLARNQPALIINVGSWVSQGLPLAPSDSPAKAFLMASNAELRLKNIIEGRDIEVLVINVLGFTGTDTIHSPPNILIPNAKTYAKAFVRSVGCGYPIVSPWLPHAVLFWVLGQLPRGIRERFLCHMIISTRRDCADNFKISRSGDKEKKTL
jgi:17beta-estradiol 17-dehydrogenase / very-long-chain 3-oxoacyl-CoA reductase